MFKKKNLIILNVALFVVVVVSCYGMVTSFVHKPQIELAKEQIKPQMVIAKAVERLPRTEYDIITRNNIFDAKLVPPPKPPPPKPLQPLNWKLQGTLRVAGEWVASIEMSTAKPQPSPDRRRRRRRNPPPVAKDVKRVKAGDTILEHDVTILEIGKDYVKHARTHEGKTIEDYLRMPGSGKPSVFGETVDYRSVVTIAIGKKNEYNVSLSELKKKVVNVAQGLKMVKLQIQKQPSDETKLAGLEVIDTENVELLRAFGIEKKDVIVKIDGQEVEGVEKLAEALGSLKDKDTLIVDVRRDNKTIPLRYHIKP